MHAASALCVPRFSTPPPRASGIPGSAPACHDLGPWLLPVPALHAAPFSAHAQGGQRASDTRYLRYNKGGCVTVTQLDSGVKYTFYVQAYSASVKGGAYASVSATPTVPPKPWRCVPVPSYYPLCSAALAGQCTPLTCAEQVGCLGPPLATMHGK